MYIVHRTELSSLILLHSLFPGEIAFLTLCLFFKAIFRTKYNERRKIAPSILTRTIKKTRTSYLIPSIINKAVLHLYRKTNENEFVNLANNV